MASSPDSSRAAASSQTHFHSSSDDTHPPIGNPLPPTADVTSQHPTKPSRWSRKNQTADPKAGAVGGGDAAVALDAATSGSAAIEIEGQAKEDVKAVGFTQMFRYHTKLELILNLIGLIAAAASGAAQPLMTLIFGKLTNSFVSFASGLSNLDPNNPASIQALRVAQDGLRHESALDALYLTVIGIGMFLSVYIYMGIWVYTGEKASKRLRENYLQSVLRQDPAYFDTLGAGEVATRIQTDTDLVQSGISEKVAIAVSYVATFVTGFVLAYARSWRLALAMSSILPCIMVTGAFMGKFGTKYKVASLQYIAESSSLAEEVISTIRIAQSFGTQSRLARKFDSVVGPSLTVGIKNAVVSAVGLGLMFFVIYASYGLAFVYGVILINQGRANAGIVVNVFMSILIGSFSLAMLAPEIQTITNARGAAAKLFQTMDRIPIIDSLSEEGLKPAQCIGHLEFQDVLFHYPSRPGVPILQGNGLSVSFPAGKTAALVGSSGSGKSTVIALAERFYDPIAGRVLLDGVDIRELNVKWLRQNIGLVSQEPVLFATTVRGNVEYGLIGTPHEHASDDVKFALVKEACIKANAHGFIEGLTEGYNTMVGESGMLLSGGQKQRVAIARAIVSDPKILLLDEATSALDTLSEGIVQDALDKASAGRTTITIAHRLSTIKDCNMILVMGQGQVLEQGTHNELLASPDGAYAALVSAQKLATMDDSTTLANNSSDEEINDPEKKIFTPEEAEDFAAHEKPKMLTRASTGGASLSSEALKGIKGESERGKTLNYGIIFKRLFDINRSETKYYILGIIMSCCSGMVYPAFGILYGQALTNFSLNDPAERKHESFRSGLWYFIMAILAATAIMIQNYSLIRAAETLTLRLRNLSFRAIIRSDIAWFDEDKNSTGALTSSLADRPQKISGLAGVTLGTIIQSIATIIGGAIIGLVYGWKLSLIGIACIPLIIFAGYIRLRLVVLKDVSNKQAHEHSSNLACEAAGSIRTVASLTREADALRVYSESLNGPLLKAKKTLIYSNALYALSQAMSLWVIALVFYVGSRWIANLSYSINSFFVVLMSVTFGAIQAGNVFSFVPDISQAQSAASGIIHLLDSRPEIDAESTEGKMVTREAVRGHLRFENVHFRYPTRPGVRVLRNLNLDVKPGQFVALVGGSGCGKSTTIQLASRFYDPLAGSVTLDGIPLNELNVSSFRSCISLVSQEPTLYSGTIRENICLGAIKPADEVTQEELETACRSANIMEFVSSLPQGFETQVGGKGAQLSGGQKQRLAIARALIRNPKILLLDEATSALDSTSEKVVQAALDNAAKGRTTISIAHRLSTIQHADQIYFFKDGRVAEAGTHQELIALHGGYAELCQMQSLSRT